jgi:hypothetical protein
MISREKIIISVILVSSILSYVSCVEPIVPDLKESDTQNVMVVDGTITDEEGPFIVKLTTSVPVNELYSPKPVLDAEVRVFDDKGDDVQLFGDNNGIYESTDKDLKGIPGNTYTLAITTIEGMQYMSTSVLMQEAPDIDSVYFEEVEHTRFEGNQTIGETWLNILLNTHDSEDKTKYWHFEFEETWEVRMLSGQVPVYHDPLNGAAFTWENVAISGDKQICWVTKPSSSVLIASTVNSPVNEINKFIVQSLGPDEDKLHIGYSILVKQSPISHELYDFWKELKDVNETVGGLYEKMPSQVFGNISCCNGTSKALGYFSALSVREKRIFINKTQHHIHTVSAYGECKYFDYVPMGAIPIYFGTIQKTRTDVYSHSDFCADCRAYGTNVKPDFWE